MTCGPGKTSEKSGHCQSDQTLCCLLEDTWISWLSTANSEESDLIVLIPCLSASAFSHVMFFFLTFSLLAATYIL